MPTPKADAKGPIKTIVYVENDRLLLEAITEVLTSKGYVVHTAEDGLKALAVIRQVKPDCIVLDIVIPKLDGRQVCAAVRQDPILRSIPVIAFSGLDRKDYALFPELSADAYVAKGPLADASRNLLKAIRSIEEQGPAATEGQLLGYENFRPRELIKELLLERSHLRAILRAIVPGALELDRDGRIVMANPWACKILGKTEGQLAGELFSSLFPPRHRKGVQDVVTDLVRSEEPAQCRTAFQFFGKVLAVRLAPVVEENTCTALLVILEGEMPEKSSGR
jgi:PAS domain S-box-containing protein